jgi:hypothetical protein
MNITTDVNEFMKNKFLSTFSRKALKIDELDTVETVIASGKKPITKAPIKKGKELMKQGFVS